MKDRILLVEDDAFLREGLAEALEGQGYDVVTAGCIRDARTALDTQSFRLLILDIGLPDGSSLAFCSSLRAESNMLPVLFLTACDDEIQIISGLDAGGDDYVTKPFRLRELMSRVRALLRRTQPQTYTDNGFSFDMTNNTVLCDGIPVFLTPTEGQILQLLLRDRGNTVTRSFLLQNIWDAAGEFIDDNTLSVHIRRLREKIGVQRIATVRGIGYRWEENR